MIAGQPSAEDKNETVALLTFEKWQDLVKFTKVASDAKLKLLGPRAVAKEIIRLQNTVEKIQPLDLLLIDVLNELSTLCAKLPLVGHNDVGKDIAVLKLNLVDHLSKMPTQQQAQNYSASSVLVAQGPNIKLLHSVSSAQQNPFNNFPVNPTDEVLLRICLKDSLYLVSKIAGNDPALASFFERLASDFNGDSVYVRYVDALGAI